MSKFELHHDPINDLKTKLKTLGIIGMEYVGLPLDVVAAEGRQTVIPECTTYPGTSSEVVLSMRESPALDLLYHLERRGALIQYHDSFCPIIRADESLPIHGLPMESQPLTKASIQKADVVVIVTDHNDVDYELVASQAKAIVDTRVAIDA